MKSLGWIVTAVAFFSSASVFAAQIDWGTIQSTTSSAANDVVDGGLVVLAINGRSQSDTSSRRPPMSVTLDGIEFESVPIRDFLGRGARDVAAALSSPSSTGDPDYDAFLTHVAWADVSAAGLAGTDTNAIYPIEGLTENTEYLIQLWYTDERPGFISGATPRVGIFGDNERLENTVVLPGQGENGFGTFVVGSFVADDWFQDLRLETTQAAGAHLTGILVREEFPCTLGTGDFDRDGVVRLADFLVLAQNFGKTARPVEGDIDCNGTVEFADFLILAGNFGSVVSGAQSVPEPHGYALWCTAALTLMILRQRRS